jgi:thioredoxin-related protein
MNFGAVQRFTAGLILLVPLLAAGVALAAGEPGTGQAQPAGPRVLVFGLGERCRYCVQLKQEIAKVVAVTGDTVKFVDYRVDLDREMVARHNVVLSPTLVFIDSSGTEVFRHQGLLDAAQIQEKLVELRLWTRRG